jgi:hypothetical protein
VSLYGLCYIKTAQFRLSVPQSLRLGLALGLCRLVLRLCNPLALSLVFGPVINRTLTTTVIRVLALAANQGSVLFSVRTAFVGAQIFAMCV